MQFGNRELKQKASESCIARELPFSEQQKIPATFACVVI